MTKIKVDTSSFNRLVNDFNSCVQSYNSSVDSFFQEIARCEAWEGDAADKYKEVTAGDKVKYTDFGDSLSKFVNLLYDISGNLERTASSSKR